MQGKQKLFKISLRLCEISIACVLLKIGLPRGLPNADLTYVLMVHTVWLPSMWWVADAHLRGHQITTPQAIRENNCALGTPSQRRGWDARRSPSFQDRILPSALLQACAGALQVVGLRTIQRRRGISPCPAIRPNECILGTARQRRAWNARRPPHFQDGILTTWLRQACAETFRIMELRRVQRRCRMSPLGVMKVCTRLWSQLCVQRCL